MTPQEKAKYYVDSFRHMVYEKYNYVYLGLDDQMARDIAQFMLEIMMPDLELNEEQALFFAQVYSEIYNYKNK